VEKVSEALGLAFNLKVELVSTSSEMFPINGMTITCHWVTSG